MQWMLSHQLQARYTLEQYAYVLYKLYNTENTKILWLKTMNVNGKTASFNSSQL
jgi:hypothetical protein